MRLDTDTFREIGQTLGRNKARTVLTGFGIFWGMFMLLTMLGAGDGLKSVLSNLFNGFASNTIICTSAPTGEPYKGFQRGRRWSITEADLDIVRDRVPGIDIITPMQHRYGWTAKREGRSLEYCTFRGIFPEYAKIETPVMRYGRFINQTDIEQGRKVCVIGRKLYETLFPEGGDPTGQYIQFEGAGTTFMVIGVDVSKGAISIGSNSDNRITIPYTVFDRMFPHGDEIDMFCMTARRDVSSEHVQEQVRQTLYQLHDVSPTDTDAMFLLDTAKIFSIVDNLFRGLDILIFLVGLGTLLAGAIGVSNIMMVTVKERTVEIGIRRAIGATPKMIVGQVMAESVALTLVAGIIGILLSVGVLGLATMVLSQSEGLEGISFQIGFWTEVVALLLIIALGVLAGLAPASRAMEIKPVEAIADE